MPGEGPPSGSEANRAADVALAQSPVIGDMAAELVAVQGARRGVVGSTIGSVARAIALAIIGGSGKETQ